jgi:hypothetical protein
MIIDEIFIEDPITLEALVKLRKYFEAYQGSTIVDLLTLWRALKQLQVENGGSPDAAFTKVRHLFRQLGEIREVFELENADYWLLNELYIEITMVKSMLNVPPDLSLREFLGNLNPTRLPQLGVGKNSMLERFLYLFQFK